MLQIQPILGDGLIDLLAKGIPIILFVLWLIGQAVTEKQKQAKKVAAPRPPRPVPPPDQGPLQPKAQRAATEEVDLVMPVPSGYADTTCPPARSRRPVRDDQTSLDPEG